MFRKNDHALRDGTPPFAEATEDRYRAVATAYCMTPINISVNQRTSAVSCFLSLIAQRSTWEAGFPFLDLLQFLSELLVECLKFRADGFSVAENQVVIEIGLSTSVTIQSFP